mgnify:CR=1 FL=1
MIDAYTEQTYGNWQLCLADACEGEETGEFLRKKYKKEIRLSYKKVTENNGISGNLNASLKLAMGEYVLFAGQEIIPELMHFSDGQSDHREKSGYDLYR